MASVGKEITAEKFEEYLSDFSVENKVNIDIPAVMRRLKSVREELKDDMESYHSFYSDFALYIEDSNSIDNTGNISPIILSTFTKQKKEEIKHKKEQEAIKSKMQKDNIFEILENNKLSAEEIKETIVNMNFEQLTFEDLSTVLYNYDEAKKVMTDKQKEIFTHAVGTILGTEEVLTTLLDISARYEKNGYKLTEEDIYILQQIPPEKLEEYNLDRYNLEESFEKELPGYLEASNAQIVLLTEIIQTIDVNGTISAKDIELLLRQSKYDIFKKFPTAINQEKLLSGDLSKKDIEEELIKLRTKMYDNAVNENVVNEYNTSDAFQQLYWKERYVLENMLEVMQQGKDVSRDDILKILEHAGLELSLGQELVGVDIGDLLSGKVTEQELQDLLNQYKVESEQGAPVQEDNSQEQVSLGGSEINLSAAFDIFNNVMGVDLDLGNVNEKDDEQLQIENTQLIEEQYKKNAVEYYQEEQQIDIDGQTIISDLQNQAQQVKPIEPEVKVQKTFELDQINQEEVEQEVQEEIDNSDYQQEIDEKTGIAGLFAAIANSRVGRAVKNLFKTKDAQKRLNAPVTQRTEDGLKITEYESNGSLMPTTIQARNFLRDFAVNTVEAVTNFANNISDAIRGSKKDEVINKPTIIKSEPVQEQAEKIEQQPVVEQIQEKTETFNDTNKWAVSNESRQRQAELNAAQAQKNSAQVGKIQDKTQEQNRENKESNEGR